MKNNIKKHTFLLVFTATLGFLNAQNGLSGYWIDTTDVNGSKLRLVLHFYQKDTIMALDFYSLDQTKAAIPLKNWHREKDSIFAKEKKSNLDFSLEYNSQNQQINGILKQGKLETFLAFSPIDSLPKTLRPQTPQPPFPYKIEEVSFPNKAEKIMLSATLTLPENEKPLKTIVLIAGSGRNDRDETIHEHKLFWVLADALTRQGYAVLRYDKRGVGHSQGDYAKATTTDFYEDACAAISFLRQDKRIDPNSIGVIGHSEGGLIATMIAAKDKKLAFAVSLAGIVQTGRELLIDQARLLMQSIGRSEDSIAPVIRLNTFLYDEVIKNGKSKDFAKKLSAALDNYELTMSKEEKEILSWSPALKMTCLSQLSSPFWIELITTSPEKYTDKMQCPVLAIFGEKDIQVPAQKNADLMRKSLQKANNEYYSRVEIIQGANHLFQKCNLCTVYEYGWLEETIAPEVLDLLVNWIKDKN